MPTTSPEPLVSVTELAGLLDRPDPPVLLDARWSLPGQGPSGRDQYRRAHLPGAVYVDVGTDLSDPPGPGTGRHPLPGKERFQAAMRLAGVRADRPVVVYDAPDPISGAARAWWLLRYFGHQDVRVLDGGFAAWQAAGLPLTAEVPTPTLGDWQARPGGMPLLRAADIPAVARDHVLLDFRAPERYRGDHEPLDPVAGHIPGARNLPASQTMRADGRQLPPAVLRERLAALGVGGGAVVGAYCGSGVAAAQGVLALRVAGLDGALYLGSWSEWVADPSRPVATGPEPGAYPPEPRGRQGG
jgi:thiosulfate/3-mercaptopyruvate sulfurtransferase